MNLLDLVHRHRRQATVGERSEQREESRPGAVDNSLLSLSSQSPAPAKPEAEMCAAWLIRFVRARYPRLADVRAAAKAAGFGTAAVEASLRHADIVVYRTFPRRNAPEVERVRSVDDWPDDPPLAGR